MEKSRKYLYILATCGIGVLALALRLCFLNEIPFGLQIEEAGNGYDGWALANWGLDRYYKFYPIYFLGGSKQGGPLYTYLCAALFRFVDLSVMNIRLPAVVMGMGSWVFGTLIFQECFDRKTAFSGSLFLATMPCFVMQSRLALSCLLFLPLSTAGLYFLILAGKKRNRIWFALSGISFGFCLYAYMSAFFLLLGFLFLEGVVLIHCKKMNKKESLVWVVSFGAVSLPFWLFLFWNLLDMPEISTIYFSIPKVDLSDIFVYDFGNMVNNVPVIIRSLLFGDGSRYDSVPNCGTMYVIFLPFLYLGIQKAVLDTGRRWKSRAYAPEILILLWLAWNLIFALILKNPTTRLLNGGLYAILFFTVYGCRNVWDSWKVKKAGRACAFVVTLIYVCFCLYFCSYYFGKYQEDTFPLKDCYATYEDILQQEEEKFRERTVYVDAPAVYYALGKQLSPMEFTLIEQGEESRDNVVFGFPEELDEDGIYLLRDSEELKEKLLEAGFSEKTAGFYTIYE